MRCGLGAIQMAQVPVGIEQDCAGRCAHALGIGVFFGGGDVALTARRGRYHREPHHSLRRPLFLQALHVAALIMLAGVRASLVVPLQHHEFSAIGRKSVRAAVAVGSGEIGRGFADLGRKSRETEKADNQER